MCGPHTDLLFYTFGPDDILSLTWLSYGTSVFTTRVRVVGTRDLGCGWGFGRGRRRKTPDSYDKMYVTQLLLRNYHIIYTHTIIT